MSLSPCVLYTTADDQSDNLAATLATVDVYSCDFFPNLFSRVQFRTDFQREYTRFRDTRIPVQH